MRVLCLEAFVLGGYAWRFGTRAVLTAGTARRRGAWPISLVNREVYSRMSQKMRCTALTPQVRQPINLIQKSAQLAALSHVA